MCVCVCVGVGVCVCVCIFVAIGLHISTSMDENGGPFNMQRVLKTYTILMPLVKQEIV